MRAKMAVLGLVAALLAASPAVAGPDGPVAAQLVRTQLAEGVYQFTVPSDGYVSSVNSVVIVNDADVVVFDTFTLPSSAEALVRMIRQITDKPVRTIINSHWHPDHWTGNAVLAREWPGVEIITTARTADVMRNVAPAWPAVFDGIYARARKAYDEELRTGKHADGSAVTPEEAATAVGDAVVLKNLVDEQRSAVRAYPTRTYEGQLTLRHGRRELRLTSMTGDASDSTVLYLPRERILVTGDLIVHPVTWTTQSYAIAAWRDSLRALARLDAATIVPGHGPTLHDDLYIELVAEFFDTVMTQVRAGLAKGLVTPDEILPTIHVEGIRARFAHGDEELGRSFDGTLKNLVTKVYQEARDGMTSRR